MSPITANSEGSSIQISKPIRFVAAYDGPSSSKKRRITAACGTCRRRKTRCDGTRPECTTCKESGNRCMGYETTEKSKNDSVEADAGRLREDKGTRDGEPPIRQPASMLLDNATTEAKIPNTRVMDNDAFTTMASPAYSQAILDDPEPDNPPPRNGRTIPYFRYFGPTAIVPGFKQMVVKVKKHRGSTESASAPSMTSPSRRRRLSSDAVLEPPTAASIPLYDPDDSSPLHPLIKHLVETFFVHLGCNFPFLRRVYFLRRLEEKTVETILVDAVCALAARFSTHPLLAIPGSSELRDDLDDLKHPKSDYGIVFAQRARSAVVDSFPCPTVASVQACLLLAYEGFGTNQDSALWMYLGCAIRMAQDLGLQKKEGIKHLVQQELDQLGLDNVELTGSYTQNRTPEDQPDEEEALDLEQCYVNTYWAVLMLDRVISSGTGRPVTLRDQDMDLSFPPYSFDVETGWPVPFPALIRVIHIYGRVSDLLNNIQYADDLNPNAVIRLDEMEQDLTSLYQKLDSRLTFHVVNFQHYARAGQGTNFILLHFWFHTLIIILHQPKLLHSFEGSIQQLFPNSHELSMSSAKTIADILAFAELTDAKSFVNNPFTSQPMYIAASAFLMEIRAQSGSRATSRATSPVRPPPNPEASAKEPEFKGSSRRSKHGLLASAARENYQRCYKALQQLEKYWAGTKYILTALDQKAKGIWDAGSLETYTAEEMENAKRNKTYPFSNSPASDRAKSRPGAETSTPDDQARVVEKKREPPARTGSFSMNDFGQMWTLNGNTNSRNANLTFLYQNPSTETSDAPTNESSSISNPRLRAPRQNSTAIANSHAVAPTQVQQQYPAHYTPNPYTTPLAENTSPGNASILNEWTLANQILQTDYMNSSPYMDYRMPPPFFDFFQNHTGSGSGGSGLSGGDTVGDIMVESQDIDIPLEPDMMPWLEYLPRDMLGEPDSMNNATGNGSGDGRAP